jgi:hypothetical protein
MEKIIKLILILGSLTLRADGLFLYDITNKVEISDIRDNKLNVFKSEIGKTYPLKNSLSVTTDATANCLYVLPHEIAIHQREMTSVYFSGDIIQYYNDFTIPSVVKIKEHLFNLSLNGEVYIVSKNTNQNTIGTSMANIIFENAKLFIKSGDKYTHVYVIDGKCTVLDTKSSKKKKELNQNDYLVITPQVLLSPRDGYLKANGNSFSTRDVDEDETSIHKKQIEDLQSKLNNTLFVNYDTNIFGLKLRLP